VRYKVRIVRYILTIARNRLAILTLKHTIVSLYVENLTSSNILTSFLRILRYKLKKVIKSNSKEKNTLF